MFFSVMSSDVNCILFNKKDVEKTKRKYADARIKTYEDIASAINEVRPPESSKIYAVKRGFIPGIYFSWDDCKKQTDGFSGPIFKSFKITEETLKFISDIISSEKETKKEKLTEKEKCAYVDGSYNSSTGVYGFGVVLFANGEKYIISGNGNEKEKASMRNVAGEIMGAISAIQKGIELRLPEIKIYYDYQGIEAWATGEWKRNKEYTKEYYDFVQQAKKSIKVEFEKVKAHSGVEYNELADKTAKKAAGI